MTLVLLMVVLLVTWGYNANGASQEKPNSAFKLGVVDVSKALKQCREYINIENKMMEKQKKVVAELKKLDDESKDIRSELDNLLTPGSTEYNKQLKEWVDKQVELEGMKKYHDMLMTTEAQTETEEIYLKLLAAIEGVAVKESVSLVLNKEDMPVKSRTMEELTTKIRMRQVLYNIKELDVTALVVSELDANYIKSTK